MLVLVNLFLHCAFGLRLFRNFPEVRSERYADDAVVHCDSERRARAVIKTTGGRREEAGLRLHPAKTRIVYCGRDGCHDGVAAPSFTFLCFTYQRRPARDRNGKIFTSFLPAPSKDALKERGREIRSWRLHGHTGYTLGEFA